MYLKFLTVFFLSLFFIKIVIHYAPTLGLVDIPNERSSHTKSTPSGAGIGFIFAIFAVMPFFYANVFQNYTLLFFAILLVFTIGILDDHHDTSPKTKFIILIISTLFAIFDDFTIDYVGTFFGKEIFLLWFSIPFTIFAVVAFTNALNLIDGLDGLAGSVSIVIFISFFVIGYQNNDLILMIISGSFIAGLSAFLFYNSYPASIFMGDSGSLVIGFVISLLAIRSLMYIQAISILFITAIPIIDTIIIVIRRKEAKKSIFAADKCHLHHILHQFFANDTQKTVLFFTVLQGAYSLTGLQFTREHAGEYLLLIFILNVAMVYLFTDAMIKRQGRSCGKNEIQNGTQDQ